MTPRDETAEKLRDEVRRHVEIEAGFGVEFVPRGADPGAELTAYETSISPCARCHLSGGATSFVFGVGNPKARLMFVGEAPGREEDLQGIPFVGRAGKLLTKIIEAMGLRREEVYIANILKCRPPENRTPTPDEMAACLPYLLEQIRTIGPEVIVCLGGVAAKGLLATNESVGRLRGRFMDWHGAKLMVTYHPAYLLRNPTEKRKVWEDMQKVLDCLGLPVPK